MNTISAITSEEQDIISEALAELFSLYLSRALAARRGR